ncbi:Uncharacterised protein [Mycobacteroides abscessus subsp. abscessus]|nr:Uncharacterised protein [Mycobacteroides abscessus subsp. abscessus]
MGSGPWVPRPGRAPDEPEPEPEPSEPVPREPVPPRDPDALPRSGSEPLPTFAHGAAVARPSPETRKAPTEVATSAAVTSLRAPARVRSMVDGPLDERSDCESVAPRPSPCVTDVIQEASVTYEYYRSLAGMVTITFRRARTPTLG